MSDDENPNKRGTLKGQSDGAYKLKLGAVSPTTRFQRQVEMASSWQDTTHAMRPSNAGHRQ
eukprot:138407-Pelagomonas_calceolata.AAC.3